MLDLADEMKAIFAILALGQKYRKTQRYIFLCKNFPISNTACPLFPPSSHLASPSPITLSIPQEGQEVPRWVSSVWHIQLM